MNNTDGNISFFLKDTTIDELEDNNNILEQLLNDFENAVIDDTDDTDDTDIYGLNNDNSNFLYFAKKNMYYGNEELYYEKEYTTKELLKICQYYGLSKNIKASKCKKIDIISTIIYFENCIKNTNIVLKRHKLWAYMTELLADPKMKCYLLW